MKKRYRFGIIKPNVDAHTLGIISISQILEQCGFDVIIADKAISEAVSKISTSKYFKIIENWILHNKLSHLGFSYRLDPREGVDLFSRLIYKIDHSESLFSNNCKIADHVFFAGLKEACDLIGKRFNGRFETFMGGEDIIEVLKKFNVPETKIPKAYKEQSIYDKMLFSFGEHIIEKELQNNIGPISEYHYEKFGTRNDTLIDRLYYAKKHKNLPLIRCHVGPYLKEHEQALALFSKWLKELSKSKLLDIVSVGSSQLSQSDFGENWGDKSNGGGIPINSESELRTILDASLPMLVRAYSATKQVKKMAEILEENINIAWHALSFWWFNQLDGRGPLRLKQNLSQHIQAIKYIAKTGKPFEPNVPHHFAFRGSDDVTYITSTYIATKMAKKLGIKSLVLQNMLNTPKYTTGLMDLVKSRVLLKLIRTLEDKNFGVIYQPRAGLNYFSPDTEKAKVQLAAVTAMMCDVEHENIHSPEIIHVVGHSEALHLATPSVINESIKITKAALQHYPQYRRINYIRDLIDSKTLFEKQESLYNQARYLIRDIESTIRDPYSANGLYEIFKMGYFPVPFLWGCRDEFPLATNWRTQLINGSMKVVDDKGKELSIARRLNRIREWNWNTISKI